MIDLKNELNDAQYQAARHVDGPILVIAGAGSGKTRVITYRIANLIEQHRVPPWRIMAVTFTNKAAKEMAERVEKLVDGNSDCWISTFHSSCARFLRKWGDLAGIDPKFTIYDDSDQKAMVNRVLKELQLSNKQFPPRAIQSEINRAKRELINPDDYDEYDYYRRTVKQVYTLYEKRMRDANALDFGDLLKVTVCSIKDSQPFRDALCGRFDYVMVDEFQDTNKVQLEFIRLLAPHRNICVVGDDDQSIYSWRGADVTNILDFEKIFSGAKVVTLDRNYRSCHNILKASGAVVSRLPDRRKKTLWTDQPDGDPIRLITTPDEREEGRLVARKIREMEAAGTSLNDQVVFYRTNAQSRVFEEVFRSMNLPHRIVGGMRFYERAEIKDLIAFMRLVQNPQDHAAFVRVINVPPRGIGKTTVDRLVRLAAGHGISAFEAIALAHKEMRAPAVKKLTDFSKLVKSWQQTAQQGPLALIGRIIADTGYQRNLEMENTAEADARTENIKEFVGSIEDFEAEAEEASLTNFLELVALQTDVDAANFAGDQVTLMTVHAAKGLEFDTVYVTGMEEGVFPLIRQGDMAFEDSDAIDEERRLAYVAMTRAKRQLYLTRARERRLYGQVRLNPPSRFIQNIPPAILLDISPDGPEVRSLGQPTRRGGFSSAMGSSFGRFAGGQSGAPTAQARPAAQPRSPHVPFGLSRTTPNKQRPKSDVWIDASFDQSAPPQLSPGQVVSHPRFGQGTVMGIIPGAKPKADIQFPGYGRKTILIKYLEI